MKKGFTIIEVIIAIALLGILTLLLTSILSFSLNNYSESIEKQEEQFDVRLATDIITREVRNAITIEVSDTFTATGDNWYLYQVANDLMIIKGTDGTTIGYTDGKIQSIVFTLSARDTDRIFLDFSVVGINNYKLDSSVLLNNIKSDDITITLPYEGSVVIFEKP
jgi:prepilin-type N-terminal cleavage/methylation domain-containing protein